MILLSKEWYLFKINNYCFGYVLISLKYIQVLTIQKELTIVGCSAFLFKIVVNSSSFLPSDWYFALEYADLLVPIFSLSYCAIGGGLIIMSMRHSYIWRRAHHLHIFEILSDSTQDNLAPTSAWSALFWNKKSEIEFRIFRNIFCDLFKVKRTAFQFDAYAENVFDRCVIRIIKIRPFDRFLLCVVLLLNLMRVHLNISYATCHRSSMSSSYATDESFIVCEDQQSIILFTLAGAAVFLVTCAFAVLARRIQILILQKNGISTVKQYASFLQSMELDDNTSVDSVQQHLDKEQLKVIVIDAIQSARRKKVGSPWSLSHWFRMLRGQKQKRKGDVFFFDLLHSHLNTSYTGGPVISAENSGKKHIIQYTQIPLVGPKKRYKVIEIVEDDSWMDPRLPQQREVGDDDVLPFKDLEEDSHNNRNYGGRPASLQRYGLS